MATPIHVTVMPQLPNGKEVPCGIRGPAKYVQDDTIWLDAGQDYDITFELAGANGVNGWHSTTPFGNQQGIGCPGASQGASGPFGHSPPAGGQLSVSVRQPSRSLNSYRLNFNDDFYCDPIIVVG
jgi:hypothetical protein